MTLKTSTLRPGLLVSLKTSVVGGVEYKTFDIETDHITEQGERCARWETERTIEDPTEHEAAVKLRSKVRAMITSVCAGSDFGLLCPDKSVGKLEEAILDARKTVEEFNKATNISKVNFFIITGQIVPDDVEAVRAINSEVSELLGNMEKGLENLDVGAIRAAANRARNLGSMLSTDAAERVQTAITTARAAARKIVEAGEQAAQEVDRVSIRKISEMRTAFLDIDDAKIDDSEDHQVAMPAAEARAIDLVPGETAAAPAPAAAPQIEME